MAALAKDRNTPEVAGMLRELEVAASTLIYAGALVAVNASGYAVPGSTATTLRGIGRAEARADNSDGAAGAIRVRVGAGIYRFGNSASTDLIARDDIGKTCYIVDDQTVALTDGTGTRSIAGKIYDVDAQGVWVDFR